MTVETEAVVSKLTPEARRRIVEEARAIREKADAEGLEVWDVDRMDAEVRKLRGDEGSL